MGIKATTKALINTSKRSYLKKINNTNSFLIRKEGVTRRRRIIENVVRACAIYYRLLSSPYQCSITFYDMGNWR